MRINPKKTGDNNEWEENAVLEKERHGEFAAKFCSDEKNSG